ncbi:MAG: NADH-quinone oxidoreductase subunit F [Thermomicrobiales bacterium]|nr:NADH-quinone oxidoreductase subunit F [Thermomicrobiales bacterium]MCO5217681.1 NADH-quinone oxidoreductase subunit F [Thermomicrobiales bacterium]MCO5225527.1 NADH-quinone oxidoreductase subunit F [Thermomicrobiales bacterium]
MVSVKPSAHLTRLNSKDDYIAFREHAHRKWDALWNGDATLVSVGVGSSSIAKGALEVLEQAHQVAGDAIVREVSGNGAFWMEPWIEIKRPGVDPVVYGPLTVDDVAGVIAGTRDDLAVGVRGENPVGDIRPLTEIDFFKHQVPLLTRNAGVIEPDSIEDAIARGAYDGYFKVLFEISQEQAIAEVTTANVRGRGGGGFPAGIKWESGRKARNNPKFIVCNSHEGEPNVYKDRHLHECDPHRILEGIMIACIACGAERGYNYIGGEYPLGIRRFRKAVANAERLGLIGKNVLGTGKNVAIRVRTGGGAYVCGEASALMYSIMGVRGQPRTKPPRSVEEGLWKRPTVANNTETLANMPDIIVRGGEWYASLGTENSKGTKLMTMQGPSKLSGVVEVEMGVTMRHLLNDIYGGMREGYTFKGIQTGGASAGPITEDAFDLAIDFDSLGPLNGMLGSGGWVLFDEDVCAVDMARYLTAFSRYESCSKCVPCRLGNPALVEILDRIRFGRGSLEDLALIRRTSSHIIELSLCGLGQVAPVPLVAFLDTYEEEFRQHIVDGVCKCGVCPISAPSRETMLEEVAAD